MWLETKRLNKSLEEKRRERDGIGKNCSHNSKPKTTHNKFSVRSGVFASARCYNSKPKTTHNKFSVRSGVFASARFEFHCWSLHQYNISYTERAKKQTRHLNVPVMARLTHNVTGTLHFLTFLLSIPLLSMGIWLAAKTNTYCERFLQWPVLCIGVLLMLVSLLGFVAACFRITWMLCICLLVMFMLIILLFCFTVFAFVVTNKGCGQAVSNRGYKEYRLRDYSNWLQNRVRTPNNWRRIRRCIEDAKICKKLAGDSTHEKEDDFNKRKLAPVQAGCCVPPSSCRFDYQNATYWTPRGATNATWNGDCKRWSNDEDKLCYDCDACRAGVAANVKRNWQKIAVADVVVLAALLLVYSIGCCAVRRSNGEYDRFGRKG